MRLLCFFGSGVSRATGLPMSAGITKALLEGQWHKHTDGSFYQGAGGLKLDGLDVAATAQNFLRLLKESVRPYLGARKAGFPNYEHLFSLAKTIEDELSGESLNPATVDFVERISQQTRYLWTNFSDVPWSGTRNDRLASLAMRSLVLIESVVRHQLGACKNPVGFKALLQLVSDTERFEHIDVVTLNHDLVLETLFEREGISFCDGFSLRDGEVRFYDDRAFAASERIHLLKPHGSINWRSFRKHSNDRSTDRHGIPDPGKGAWHVKDDDGNWFHNLAGNPVFLTGISKTPRYATGIFGKQVSWFRRSLELTKRVVCSGYGWRDDGMNDLLFEWLYSSTHNRFIMLHDGKKIEGDLLRPPSPWPFRYHELLESGQLKVIPRWLCCCRDASAIVSALS
jgi:hypothetical protein